MPIKLLSIVFGARSSERATDDPLRALMTRLHEHFELVRAVRFAHGPE